MSLQKIPTETEVNKQFTSQQNNIDLLRLDFALNGIGLEDAFLENFTDEDGIIKMGGVRIETDEDGYIEMQSLIHIDDLVEDSKEYSYDFNDLEEVDDFDVVMTGIDNVGTVSETDSANRGEILDIGIYSDKEPQNETLTISGTVDELERSVEGSGSDESITIDGGSLGESNGSVSITNQPGGSYDISASEFDGQFIHPGDSYSWTIPTSNIEKINSLTIRYYDSDQSDHNDSNSASLSINGTTLGTWNLHNTSSLQTESFSGDVSVGSSATMTLAVHGSGDRSDLGFGDGHNPQHGWLKYSEGDTTTVVQTPSGSETLSSNGTVDFELTDGEETISIEAGRDVDYTIDWIERNGVKDISVDFAGETITHSGELDGSIIEQVNLETGTETMFVNYEGLDGALNYNVEYDSTTITRNPSVTVNGNTVDYTGTLDDGEEIPLEVNTEYFGEGPNTLVLSTDSPDVGPLGRLNVDIEAWSEEGTIELVKFETGYPVKEAVLSHTIENHENVEYVLIDDSGNTFDINESNVETFVQPDFEADNIALIIKLQDRNEKLEAVSLFTSPEVQA